MHAEKGHEEDGQSESYGPRTWITDHIDYIHLEITRRMLARITPLPCRIVQMCTPTDRRAYERLWGGSTAVIDLRGQDPPGSGHRAQAADW